MPPPGIVLTPPHTTSFGRVRRYSSAPACIALHTPFRRCAPTRSLCSAVRAHSSGRAKTWRVADHSSSSSSGVPSGGVVVDAIALDYQWSRLWCAPHEKCGGSICPHHQNADQNAEGCRGSLLGKTKSNDFTKRLPFWQRSHTPALPTNVKNAPHHARIRQLSRPPRHRPARVLGPCRRAQRARGGVAADGGVQGVASRGEGLAANPAAAGGVQRVCQGFEGGLLEGGVEAGSGGASVGADI
jgi:hypothetical protein